jgi:hypothetical protein
MAFTGLFDAGCLLLVCALMDIAMAIEMMAANVTNFVAFKGFSFVYRAR